MDMDRYNISNGQGQLLCYNEGFFYEWVDEAVVRARQRVGLSTLLGRDYAEQKIQEANSPKWERNMVRPDYPDMTGAYPVPSL